MSDTAVKDEGGVRESGPDSVQEFASALRDLRRTAGNPTLAALSTRTGISKSVISVAFSGNALPTENTVLKLVTELGGNQLEWRLRRNALDPRSTSSVADLEEVRRRRFSPTQTAVIAITAALVSAVATSLVWGVLGGGASRSAGPPENAEGPYLAAANGVDPMRTKCKDDAVIAASEARLDNQVHVQLLYSNDCLAVWGRVTRYDGKTDGNTMTMRIWPMDDPDSERNQSRTDINLQSLYTPMIIEPDVSARICGQATVTVDGRTEDLGPKLCV
ncbi:DUF2690 domain-containing protein [Leucobacter ruminantium]|uniref:DUF2690 domain-containing protein n=1 Tax=Leucobacter ruminantium TaxID=1289170 RepID=A0A939RZ83_9MICO|nr:DUF2690 domain-containing protein [Leucobacter ruminantium]MBO1805224.1 DUF2690 domain-containing protein [Leucobacter ruminantium]